MNSMRLSAVLVAIFALAGCSEDKKQCPKCDPGYICNEASGQCVLITLGCPVGGCGANATCRQDDVCVCKAGYSDCNGDLGGSGGGCECEGGCDGAACGGAGQCDPGAPAACGPSGSYCNAGVCTPCPPGKFNCDGVNECESSQCGGTPGCDPMKAGVCGKNQFCNGTMCATCPDGKYNCDGIQECEATEPCGCDPEKRADCGDASQFCDSNRICGACPPGQYNCDGVGNCEATEQCTSQPTGPCDKECTDFSETHCVKNPAARNRCEECLGSEDCRNNPRAMGPICDTSDLAGTGFNFCICTSGADCLDSNTGRLCKIAEGVPNPLLRQCVCDTKADCPKDYPICEGSVFKRCRARCTDDSYCIRSGFQGSCDKATGECSYPDHM
jgi:hypothetical protein